MKVRRRGIWDEVEHGSGLGPFKIGKASHFDEFRILEQV